MIKMRSSIRNLEEMILEMKEGFSEVDTTRAADMVAINNYVKHQGKYNRALLWVMGGMMAYLASPSANLINLEVSFLSKIVGDGWSDWFQWMGWSFVGLLILMFIRWMTGSHMKQLSTLSRALGVGAQTKSSIRLSSMDGSVGAHGIGSASGGKGSEDASMLLTMDVHKKLIALGTKAEGAPVYKQFPGLDSEEADCWSESPGDVFKVRGPNYLHDGVKVQSRECAFKLLHVEFFAVDEGVKVENIAGRSDSFAGKVRKTASEQGKEPPFLLVICFNFPGYAFACYFQRRADAKQKDKAFDALFKMFVESGDDFRDERFKILPGIPPGGANFLVRKTVGNKVRISFFLFSFFLFSFHTYSPATHHNFFSFFSRFFPHSLSLLFFLMIMCSPPSVVVLWSSSGSTASTTSKQIWMSVEVTWQQKF